MTVPTPTELEGLLSEERAIFAELEPTGSDPERRWYWANQRLERAFVAAGPSLLARIKELSEALEPFANCADQIADTEDDEEWAKFRLLIKNYRRAALTLNRSENDVES